MTTQSKFRARFTMALIASGALCLAGGAFAKKETQNADASGQKGGASLSMKDKAFMKDAAKGGMMEVEAGKMAEQQGQSSEVKKLGSRMVTDHGKANSELMSIASSKGVQLGNEKPKMSKMDSGNFDKEYVSMMVKDHEKDLASFQSEAKNGSDPEVKAFASKTAMVIQKHLDLFKKAQASMK